MARVMICDDDQELAAQLAAALVAAGHEAETCRHTMDMLRAAAAGRFDLIALGLDMAGFDRGSSPRRRLITQLTKCARGAASPAAAQPTRRKRLRRNVNDEVEKKVS